MFFVFSLNAIYRLTAASFYWRDISFRETSKSKVVNNSWFAYLRLRPDPLVSAFNQESPTRQDEDLGRLFRLPGRPGAALLGRGSDGVGHLEEDAFGEIDYRCAALVLSLFIEGYCFKEIIEIYSWRIGETIEIVVKYLYSLSMVWILLRISQRESMLAGCITQKWPGSD